MLHQSASTWIQRRNCGATCGEGFMCSEVFDMYRRHHHLTLTVRPLVTWFLSCAEASIESIDMQQLFRNHCRHCTPVTLRVS